jgi:uncharacterized protein YdeI (YjbR/CyaY-like superfamily)
MARTLVTTLDQQTPFFAKDRSAWRTWLRRNHVRVGNVWLILSHKKARTASVSYEDAVEEALCFGWIDSRPKKRDSESYMLLFSKRKPKSLWSRANRDRAERMIAAGRMTPAGQAMIELAKETGTWAALVDVQRSVVPPDLKKALSARIKASAFFEAFPPSSKRIILEWILNAKTPETRRRRIEETVRLAARNLRANHYRP